MKNHKQRGSGPGSAKQKKRDRATEDATKGHDSGAGTNPREALPFGLSWLRSQVPGDSVALFRIGFALSMLLPILRYLGGRSDRDWAGTIVHFTYPGLRWIHPLPAAGMLALYWGLFACLLVILLGSRPLRLALACFGVGYLYQLLCDASHFNNHDYLIGLLALLLALIPDAGPARVWSRGLPSTIPAWALALLRFQIAIPYTLGGLVKLNGDWLLRSQPLTLWFERGQVEGLEGLAIHNGWIGPLLSWGGLAFDLSIVPLLLWRRTRLFAFAGAVAFHLTNSQIFDIGPFPWLMIMGTTLFLDPAWPRRLRLTHPAHLSPSPAGPGLVPTARSSTRLRIKFWLIGAFVVFQIAFPFRHFLYPGWVDWNELGSFFAWRMKLRDKSGEVRFVFFDPKTGKREAVTGMDAALTTRQRRMMLHYPDMMRQFAVFIADQVEAKTARTGLEVHVVSSVSLNGREAQPQVDPAVDLRRVPADGFSLPWIPPLRPLGREP